MEKAFIFGVKKENTGAVQSKPERSTDGIINMIRANAAANIMDFSLDADYTGDTWVASGEAWLDASLELIFRYGSQEKLALCGSGALLGLNKLAKSSGQVQLVPGASSYGIKVTQWITPFGTLQLKTHPLFSYNDVDRNNILIVDPDKLRYRYITDTTFKSDPTMMQGGQSVIDGTNEEFLTECGLEYYHPQAFGVLRGVGLDSAV